ncbi:MAG: hypothetical protein ACK4K3_13635 [Aquabacterium sp.]
MSQKQHQGAAAASSLILNGPYDEPAWHYATDPAGHLDDQQPRAERRIFAPDTPQVPLGAQDQGSMFDLNDLAADCRDKRVNLLREQVGERRKAGWAGVTSRVTRDLLQHWLAYPVDDAYDGASFNARQVFFCGGDHDEYDKFKKGLASLAAASVKAKVECTLKIELDDEAFERLYGFVSHPIAFERGKRVAVRVISQFDEESTKVVL